VKYRLHGASLTDKYISLYLKNSVRIGHSHIQFVLGRKIPLEYVGIFWKERGLNKHLRPALDMLDELIRKVMESDNLDRNEIQMIKEDAAWRLIKTLPAYGLFPDGFQLLRRAFSYDRYFPMHAFKRSLSIFSMKWYRFLQRRRFNSNRN
jgi:hypothetical protein